MKPHDPTKNILKEAIQHLEWALEYLEDFTDELDSGNPYYQIIDNHCYEIRDVCRDLKDLP
jgi:hypothetical protein